MFEASEIGRRAALALSKPTTGAVVGKHTESAYLLGDDGALLVLVASRMGWGPLNLAIPACALRRIRRGDRFRVTSGALRVGDVTFIWERAPVRACQPDWPELGEGVRSAPAERLADVRMELASAWRRIQNPVLERTLCQLGTRVTHAAAQDDSALLHPALASICGYGPGLTPAGDDWLMGWLLGARLMDVRRATASAAAVQRAIRGRTTSLSAAYLECASAGEVDSTWQAFLDALAGYLPPQEAKMAIRNALARGATSGAAAVTGLLAALDAVPAEHLAAQVVTQCLS